MSLCPMQHQPKRTQYFPSLSAVRMDSQDFSFEFIMQDSTRWSTCRSTRGSNYRMILSLRIHSCHRCPTDLILGTARGQPPWPVREFLNWVTVHKITLKSLPSKLYRSRCYDCCTIRPTSPAMGVMGLFQRSVHDYSGPVLNQRAL